MTAVVAAAAHASQQAVPAAEDPSAPSATVVVCAYSTKRWADLCLCIDALRLQTVTSAQVVLVIDHNAGLLARCRKEFDDIVVVPNEHRRGLSGARNTGVAHAVGDIVVFIDDDARAHPEWLERLLDPFEDCAVAAVGGSVSPAWARRAPKWFPPEFGWVVGCSYVGLPEARADIRNPIGANMAFRRRVFGEIGGFVEGIGRIGTNPLGCEETELSIRLRRKLANARIVLEPGAEVAHKVPSARSTFRYFVRRCYCEGKSKRVISRAVGTGLALEAERSYVRRTLVAALKRDIFVAASRNLPSGGAVIVGFAATAAGYAVELTSVGRR